MNTRPYSIKPSFGETSFDSSSDSSSDYSRNFNFGNTTNYTNEPFVIDSDASQDDMMDERVTSTRQKTRKPLKVKRNFNEFSDSSSDDSSDFDSENEREMKKKKKNSLRNSRRASQTPRVIDDNVMDLDDAFKNLGFNQTIKILIHDDREQQKNWFPRIVYDSIRSYDGDSDDDDDDAFMYEQEPGQFYR